MADRIYFRKVPAGEEMVSGETIAVLQRALLGAGHQAGTVDGIYGGDTESAVRTWQQGHGRPVTGCVDEATWTGATGQPLPSVEDRSLQLTARFEGHGFGKIEGNFDGAGLTWGIIGFTLKGGELTAILTEVDQSHPDLIDQAFGADKASRLRDLCKESWYNQLTFANLITVDHAGVTPDWTAAFATFGGYPEVQAVQLERVKGYQDRARTDAAAAGLTGELGYALCFDVAVQNGGLDDERLGKVEAWRAANPDADQQALRVAVATIVADTCNADWRADVLARKSCIATGAGTVHGGRFQLDCWGLADI